MDIVNMDMVDRDNNKDKYNEDNGDNKYNDDNNKDNNNEDNDNKDNGNKDNGNEDKEDNNMPCLRSLSPMCRDHLVDLSRTLGVIQLIERATESNTHTDDTIHINL